MSRPCIPPPPEVDDLHTRSTIPAPIEDVELPAIPPLALLPSERETLARARETTKPPKRRGKP